MKVHEAMSETPWEIDTFYPQRKIPDNFVIFFFKTNLLWIPIKKIKKKFYTMQGEIF